MGSGVLVVTNKHSDKTVRTYALCALPGGYKTRPGAVTVLALNLNPRESVRVNLGGLMGKSWRFRLTADSLDSRTIKLNNKPLKAGADGTLPTLAGELRQGETAYLDLEPRSYAFAVFPDAGADACR